MSKYLFISHFLDFTVIRKKNFKFPKDFFLKFQIIKVCFHERQFRKIELGFILHVSNFLWNTFNSFYNEFWYWN
jgi:hypothetical protein